MPALARPSRRLLSLYRHHLTPPGRALLWGLLAAITLRMGALSPPLYAALALLAALLAVAVLSGLPFRPRVHARRRLPDNPTAGRPWFYEVAVENRSRRPARDLVVEELDLPAGLEAAPPPDPQPHLAAGGRTVVSLGLTAARRGAYELKVLQAATLFPTGLIKPGRYVRTADRLLVHPRFDRIATITLPPGGRSDEGDRAHRRDGEDFAGLRDWQDGDRPRDVHWRAYARTGRLVVRETADEGRPKVALLLETKASDAVDEDGFEEAVSMAAAVAEVLLRQGYALDTVALGPELERCTEPGTRGLAPILDGLALVQPGAGLDEARLDEALAGLSAAILVLPREAEAPAALLRALEAAGVAVRVMRPEAR